MPVYEITAPDGKKLEITAPEGASEQDVLAYAQSQYKSTTKNKPINWRGLARQGLQGLTFGASDEIGAGIASIPAAIATGNNIKDVYSDMHQSLQDERKEFKDDHPYASLAAELSGGLATGGAGASRLAGAKLLKNMRPLARTAAIGATEGATYGTLAADRGERIQGGAVGGIAGGIAGPALQSAGNVVSAMGRPVVGRIKEQLLGSPGGDARRYLATVLSREGIDSVDDLGRNVPPMARAKATLADVSEGARGALEGVTADVDNPGIRRLVKETLETRNKGQMARVFDSLDDNLNVSADDTVKKAVATLKQSRADKAGPLYKAAGEKPLQVTPYMKATFENVPEVQKALSTAQQRVAAKRATGETVTHIDVIDEMKRTLDDDISALLRKGKKNLARDLIQVKNNILKDVDSQIPEYKAARNAYAGDSALLDAAEKGKSILRDDIDYLDDLVADMSESELSMFRLGAKKAIREKLMQAREGTNSVNRIASEINLERMKRAFPSDKAFNDFKKEIRFEASIFDTSRVLHNSATALRQAAQKSMDSGGVSSIEELGSDTAGIAAKAIHRLLNKGLDADAKEELGRLILTPLDELPPNIVKKLNSSIVKKLPMEQRGKALRLMKEVRDMAANSPTALPAVYAPAISGDE